MKSRKEYILISDFYAYYDRMLSRHYFASCVTVSRDTDMVMKNMIRMIIQFEIDQCSCDLDILNIKLLPHDSITISSLRDEYIQLPINENITFTEECKKAFILYYNKHKNNLRTIPNIIHNDNSWIKNVII
jgi:hypothetical protein